MALSKKLRPWSPRLLEESAETPEVGYVQIAELNSDPLRWIDGKPYGYQRPLDDSRVEKLSREYDAHLIGTIVCNRRPDGSLWVMDGQHRIAATARVGHSIILATIYNGLTPAQEARTYEQLNVARKALNSWTRFGARGSAGDHVVAAIISLCAEYGFRVGTPDRSLNSIAAVQVLEQIYGWPNGPALLRRTLDRIRSIWPTDITSRDGVFIGGLAKFIYTWDGGFAEQPAAQINWSRFNARFAKVTANDVMRAAKALKLEGGLEMNSSTYAIALRDIYNGRASFAGRLTGRVQLPSRVAPDRKPR